MADIGTALVTALTSVATGATDAIGDILPVAAPVLGGILIIRLGIKAFRSITGK